MYISNVKKITPIMFNGKNHAPDSNKNTTAPNKKESLLVGALMALATLSSPTVETKANNFDYDDFLIEYAQNSDSIAPARNITAKFRQGSDVGNCVGVATLKAFAQYEEGLEYLNSIVEKDKNNNFIVSFPKKNPITINKNIINRYEAVIGNDYAEAITFALYKDAGNLDDNGNMKQGKKVISSQIALHERATFQRLTGIEPNCSFGETKDLEKIEKAIKSGEKLLITTSFKKGIESVTDYKAFPKHEFTVIGVDINNNNVQVTNPWYDDDSKIINMSVKDFQKYNCGMNILQMNTNNGKTSFSNPDIGTKPGEVDYGDYFKIIDYNPTAKDYQTYFSQEKYRKGENNEFTISFWNEFDKEGYEYFYDKKKARITADEIEKHMPVYSLLKAEGHTPISLVKQYMKTKTVPEFRNKKLQKQREDIKNWLEEHYELIKYEVQIDHYMVEKSIEEARIKAELEAARRAEEEARIAAEKEAQRAIEIHNNMMISQLKKETFDSIPDRTGMEVFPNDLAKTKELYYDAKVTTDSKGNKYITTKIFRGETTIFKFDKKGHILSEKTTLNGKTTNSTIYTYYDNGVRMSETKSKYGNTTNQEIFDEKGNLIAYNSYDHDNNTSRKTSYITSPKGELLEKSYIRKSLRGNKKYSLDTTLKFKYEYEFNDDGSVKIRNWYYAIYPNKENSIIDKETTEYCADGTEKIYYNDELKATRRNGTTYDMNGNKLSSYTLKYLPSAPKENNNQ